MEPLNSGNLFSILSLPYKQIFNAMPGYAMIVSSNFRIVECNRRFIDDFGNVRGSLCFKILRQKQDACEICNLAKTFQDKKEHRNEQKLITQSGEVVRVIANTVPILNDEGEVAAVMVMYTDVTPIVKLKDELIKSERRYRNLFDKVPCYISIQDADLKIVDMNDRFREDFVQHPGDYCFKSYKHREEPCMVCPVLATFKDGQDHLREEVVTNSKGEKINVLVHSAPIKNEDGNVEYVMEMSSNITQVRQLQDKLQSLGLLVGSISHGIKGVLTGLDGGIYMMNSGFNKDDMTRIKKGWDMIQRNVSRIRSMVMDMLYYAKDREPNWEATDPLKLINDVCEILKNKVEEHHIRFTRDFKDNITDFEADSRALHSMLINILENSIDACRTDSKKEDHFINVKLKSNQDHVIFDIEDNGIGMDQETRERLFSLFFSSKGTEGTGLGLFISNKIAQQHGGIIVVKSEPGMGSHFSVKIPKRIPEDMKKSTEMT